MSRDTCWYCGGRLIWGGDHDLSEEDDHFDMSSNLTCAQCQAHVVYYRIWKISEPKKELAGWKQYALMFVVFLIIALLA